MRLNRLTYGYAQDRQRICSGNFAVAGEIADLQRAIRSTYGRTKREQGIRDRQFPVARRIAADRFRDGRGRRRRRTIGSQRYATRADPSVARVVGAADIAVVAATSVDVRSVAGVAAFVAGFAAVRVAIWSRAGIAGMHRATPVVAEVGAIAE